MTTTKFVVRGHSMRPAFQPGDLLVLEPIRGEDVRRGNVVVYRTAQDRPDNWIVHRVIGFQARDGHQYLITRGDNTTGHDAPVSPEALVGRVTARCERGTIRPIRRREELFWLVARSLARHYRRLRSRVLLRIAPLLSVLFWTRLVRITRVSVGSRQMALVRGRVVARQIHTSEGIRVWIHPLFRRMKRVRLL